MVFLFFVVFLKRFFALFIAFLSRFLPKTTKNFDKCFNFCGFGLKRGFLNLIIKPQKSNKNNTI